MATGSILVYAYILIYCFKELGFEKEGFEVEIFLFLATENAEILSQLGVLGRPCSKSELLPRGPAVVHGCILRYATIV